MSCKRWKRRMRGRSWSYSEWDHDGDTRWSGNSWGGNPWGRAAWAGPGFFGGRNFRILSGLRRDPWHGKVSGVCAGLAGYYGLNLKLIRIGLIVALFINPLLTIAAYAAATFLLQPLPEPPGFGGQSEMNAGTSAQNGSGSRTAEAKPAEDELPPELRFAALKDKFRELEERTGDIEGLVTSKEFHLRRDFKKMGEGDDKPDQPA